MGAVMQRCSFPAFGGLVALAFLCCGQPQAADTCTPRAAAAAVTVWPASLTVRGDGCPGPGDACRRLGESMATVDLLDDSAILIGCPSGDVAAIAATGGRTVGSVDGITLISIPTGDANAGMAPTPPATGKPR